jgi:peptidoglycan/xylan/chitin deacetylase (PgdA/CDA1 family)
VDPVPVLLYHSVAEDPPSWLAPWTVTPRVFTEQLDRIADHAVVPLRRLVAAQRGGAPLPSGAAILTFDDGYADFYWTAAPLLFRRELPVTLFVTTGAIHPPGGRPTGSLLPPAAMLNWRQVAGLDAYGVEIGGHSRTHAELDILSGRRLQDEIVLCKREVEEAVGHAVHSFAYPRGYSSRAVRHQVRRAGWTGACGGGNAFSSAADQPLRISRLAVGQLTGPEVFESWLEGGGAPTGPLPEPLRARGGRAYRRARARLARPAGA